MKQTNIKTENSGCRMQEDLLRSFCYTGRQKLSIGDLEGAYEYFKKGENTFGCAYCRFIQGRIEEAAVLLNLIRDLNPAVNWLLCLIGIINDDTKEIPSYFQIRNFYEADLNMIFLYGNKEYAIKICKGIKYLAKYNKEVYKYTARVLIDNDSLKSAILLLKKSIDIYYKDPEVHFMLGEAYRKIGNTENAKKEYRISNEVTGGYYPAIKVLKDMENN